jgi:hypothetical protein
MKTALTVEKQFHQKKKSQERLDSSLLLLKQLTLEDISPIWASCLKKENLPTFMSSRWLQLRSELHKTSKCVVGEAYGYSSTLCVDSRPPDQIQPSCYAPVHRVILACICQST